jgi:inosine-uridine nucleoside N-ribohydrolase
MAVKVLLDTDIGSNIDDAICLAYLLSNPDCNLLGITTVTSQSEKRASLASVLCKIVDKEIPIYPGASKPILLSEFQREAAQIIVLKKYEHEKNFPSGEAIEFLRKKIREYPGEINLLTIGPLTNIALLFSLDPEIPSMLKGLFMMCGNFFRKAKAYSEIEWNASADYPASSIVFNANVKKNYLFGIDVTSKLTMKREEFYEKFKKYKLLRVVSDFSKSWFESSQKVTFHDPLAAVSIFNKDICKYEKGFVQIELEKSKMQGLTRWINNPDGKHKIAISVNADKFFEKYFKVF